MVLVTSNKATQLLCLVYVGPVALEELVMCRSDIETQLADMKPGFNLLVDLTHLSFMAPECREEIGRNMELMDRTGVGLVVRVIPDPHKDMGMGILTLFHYPHHPRVVTCESMIQGLQAIVA